MKLVKDFTDRHYKLTGFSGQYLLQVDWHITSAVDVNP